MTRIKRWLRGLLAAPVFLVRLALLVPLGGLVYPLVLFAKATRLLWLAALGLIAIDYQPNYFEVGVLVGGAAGLGFFGEFLIVPVMAAVNPFGGDRDAPTDDLERAAYEAELDAMDAYYRREIELSYEAGRLDAEADFQQAHGRDD